MRYEYMQCSCCFRIYFVKIPCYYIYCLLTINGLGTILFKKERLHTSTHGNKRISIFHRCVMLTCFHFLVFWFLFWFVFSLLSLLFSKWINPSVESKQEFPERNINKYQFFSETLQISHLVLTIHIILPIQVSLVLSF